MITKGAVEPPFLCPPPMSANPPTFLTDDIGARTRAIRDAFRAIPSATIIEFVSTHPRASVREFADLHLGGVEILTTGPLGAAWMVIGVRLNKTRKRLGIPPLTRSRRWRLDPAFYPAERGLEGPMFRKWSDRRLVSRRWRRNRS